MLLIVLTACAAAPTPTMTPSPLPPATLEPSATVTATDDATATATLSVTGQPRLPLTLPPTFTPTATYTATVPPTLTLTPTLTPTLSTAQMCESFRGGFGVRGTTYTNEIPVQMTTSGAADATVELFINHVGTDFALESTIPGNTTIITVMSVDDFLEEGAYIWRASLSRGDVRDACSLTGSFYIDKPETTAEVEMTAPPVVTLSAETPTPTTND